MWSLGVTKHDIFMKKIVYISDGLFQRVKNKIGNLAFVAGAPFLTWVLYFSEGFSWASIFKGYKGIDKKTGPRFMQYASASSEYFQLPQLPPSFIDNWLVSGWNNSTNIVQKFFKVSTVSVNIYVYRC